MELDNHRIFCSGENTLPKCHQDLRLPSAHSARKIRNISINVGGLTHHLYPASRHEPVWCGRLYFSELFSIHFSDGIQKNTGLHCSGCHHELQHGWDPGACLRNVKQSVLLQHITSAYSESASRFLEQLGLRAFALLNRLPRIYSCRSLTSSNRVTLASYMTQTSEA